MFWIISGPSSVGKSTFMKSEDFFNYTNCSLEEANIVFAFELENKVDKVKEFRKDTIFHYNIARTMDSNFQRDSKNCYNYKVEDSAWDIVSDLDVEKKAIILLTSKEKLLSRVNSRISVEPHFLDINQQYKSKYWNDMYSKTNFLMLYNAWCDELESKKIEYILIDTTNFEYKVIESRGMLSNFYLS